MPLQKLKGMQSCKLAWYVKRVQLVIMKGGPCQKWWIKRKKGVDLEAEPPLIELLSTPPPPPPPPVISLGKKIRYNYKSRPELYTEILRLSVLRGQDAPWHYLHLKEFAYALTIRDLTLRTTLIGNHEKFNSL